MTDNEIIQALECCIKSTSGNDCEDLNCPACDEIGCRFMNQSTEYYPESLIQEMGKAALDLINRQKAEIDRLRYILVNFMGELFDWGNKNGVDTGIFAQTAILGKEKDDAVKQIKSEAYREFAERVKQISKEVIVPYIADTSIQEHKTGVFWYRAEDFDNLVKEMTEE